MARKVFTSFHYKPDNWRASQIRSIGKIEGNTLVSTNKWEEVTNGGSTAIEKWINDNMRGKSCVIVFVGEKTAERKWIKYEIERAWNERKGIFGINVHNLKDKNGYKATQGNNPFEYFKLGGKRLSRLCKNETSKILLKTLF